MNKTRATPAATNALQHSQQGGSLNVGAFRNRFETQQIGIFGFSCRYHFVQRGLHWFQVYFKDRRKGSLSSRRHIKPGASHWDAFSCTTSAERQTMSQKKSNTAVLHCHSQHGQHVASAFQRPESPRKSRKTVTVDIKKGPFRNATERPMIDISAWISFCGGSFRFQGLIPADGSWCRENRGGLRAG